MIETKGCAVVLHQEDTNLTVDYRNDRLTARMAGFPPEFTIHPGTRVVLVEEADSLTARPLVREIDCSIDRTALERDGSIEIDNEHLELQKSTVLDHGNADALADKAVLSVVEGGEADGVRRHGQIIAVRWLKNEW